MYMCVTGISHDESNDTIMMYLEGRAKADIIAEEFVRTEDDLGHAIVVFKHRIGNIKYINYMHKNLKLCLKMNYKDNCYVLILAWMLFFRFIFEKVWFSIIVDIQNKTK